MTDVPWKDTQVKILRDATVDGDDLSNQPGMRIECWWWSGDHERVVVEKRQLGCPELVLVDAVIGQRCMPGERNEHSHADGG